MTLIERLSGPAVGGHQGDLFSFKFNTLGAFESARNAGVDIVEMDLHLTKDGIPVVYHDHELSRFTKCRGFVHDRTYEELAECTILLTGERIPRFEDVLIWSGGSVVVNAEFKEPGPVISSARLVAKYHAYEWVYFQVKTDEQYRLLRSIDRSINILLVVRNRAEIEQIIARHDPHIIVLEIWRNADTPENIALARSHGLLTSKDSFDYDPLQEILGAKCNEVWKRGIDIAISNRPSGCVEQKKAYTSP